MLRGQGKHLKVPLSSLRGKTSTYLCRLNVDTYLTKFALTTSGFLLRDKDAISLSEIPVGSWFASCNGGKVSYPT